MSGLITEASVVEAVNAPVINGVDNANLMSVDSTEPIATKVEKIDELGKVVEKEEKEEKPADEKETAAKEEETEVTEEEEKKIAEETKKNLEETDSKNVQKRIGALTKKMRTAERETNLEREKRIELEKELAELKAKIPDTARPKKEDFEEEDDYIEALTEWKIDSKFKASQEKVLKEIKDKEEKTAVIETYEDLDTAIEKGKEKYPDYLEVTGNPDIVFSEAVLQLVLDTENPEDLMYHLASNPDESERISSLSLVKAAKEVLEIEKELAKGTEKKEEPKVPAVKKQSNAPDPITPVTTRGVTEKDPNKMSLKEYTAWRNKK